MELLQYLDMEQGWLNTLGEKVQATDNLPESTEAITEALEVQMQTHTQALTVVILSKSVNIVLAASLLLILSIF